MNHYFMGIDLGGTVTKAGIYTAEGREITVAAQTLPLLSPQAGFCERDMDELWVATCEVIRRALAESHLSAEQIYGISFSSHGKGLYLVNKTGTPIRNGIVSSDSRTQSMVAAWKAQDVDRLAYPLSFQQLWPSHPAVLLKWLKQHEPENYARTGYVLMAHDYIRYRLTGEFTCEETNISGSQLFNLQHNEFDPTLFALFGIEEMIGCMPKVIGSADLAGTLTPDAAALCGLKTGTPVFGGVFDVVGAAITSGVYDSSQLSAVAGTWSIATRVFDSIIPADYPYVWGKFSIPGHYFAHEGSPTSASNLTWFIQHFFPELQDDHDTLNQWVERGYEKPDCILFFPWLYGSNYCDSLSGGFFGLGGHHSAEDMVFAIYQGIVFSHLLHQDKLLQLSEGTQTIRFTGGPTHSRIWMQMFCDASNLPLEIVDVAQSGCRAAAMCAAVGTGDYVGFEQAIKATQPPVIRLEPDAEKHQLLRRRFERFRRVAKALSSIDCE
ncbi:FGGY-family carbohydrate kinase [Citrobacter amalonaticus]|uniref:FGGY-family carbohydrate kinase n=1 Tax=Citrobacter amalonaticus TaxID=35703 RepID=UPI00255AE993|nr:FGGY-family carbohydrate kinase [Citrobacter amalonaticus]MDL4615955.1 FGGY-family carbohydrate kinase [Citrobacter amalonaticus]MDL4624625.1 FGGY-family carbohydrate kinase [Citrobacter amalonaticus]